MRSPHVLDMGAGVVLCLAWWMMAASTSIAADGRLEVSPTHPYFFRDGDRHVLLLGVSDRAALTIWENDKGFSWRKYLDVIAAHRLNYVRQDVFSWGGVTTWVKYPGQYSHPAWPFRRVGPGNAVDGLPKFDLTQLEQAYFDERLKPFLHAARQRGVYVELTLFEGFRRVRDFNDSLLADANNVNHLGLRPRLATADAALDQPRWLSIQRGFVDKVLAETAGFGNVIYEIANETGGKRWVSYFIDYIHSHPTHPSRLVAAGEQTSAFDPRRGENDIVVIHRAGAGLYATDSDVRNHHDALLHFRAGKPVSHNEYFLFANRSTHDVNFPRKMMWADFTAGGHSNFYDFTFWRGTGRTTDDGQPSRPPPEEILRGGQYLLEFLSRNRIPFWTMAPHDELAEVDAMSKRGNAQRRGDVFTLARPGVAYVCYVLGDGPLSILLELPNGAFTTRWYDPKSGQFVGHDATVTGGDRRRFVSPVFQQDIVLLIRANG